jgi:hypothetical protein
VWAKFPLIFSIPFAGGIWSSRRFRRVVVRDESGGVLLLPDRIKEGEGKISLLLLSYCVLPLFSVPFD